MFFAHLEESPVGRLFVAGDESGLKHVSFCDSLPKDKVEHDGWQCSEKKLREPLRQLRAYFRKQLSEFELELAPEGTDFQKAVWNSLTRIPFGKTASYGDVARWIRNPAACRAVGLANGRNPIAIIIPCHRVIGSSGSLTGYGGGLDRKKTLLELESRR